MGSDLGLIPRTCCPVAWLESGRLDRRHHYWAIDSLHFLQHLPSPSLSRALPGNGVLASLRPAETWLSWTAPLRVLTGISNATCSDSDSVLSSPNPPLTSVCNVGKWYQYLPSYSENWDSPWTLPLPHFPNQISYQVQLMCKISLCSNLGPGPHPLSLRLLQ